MFSGGLGLDFGAFGAKFGANFAPTWPPKSVQEDLKIPPCFHKLQKLPAVADIAQIDKDQKPLSPHMPDKKDGRAAVPPAGEVNPPPALL